MKERAEVSLESLSDPSVAPRSEQDREALLTRFPTIDRLTAEEYMLIRDVLTEHGRQQADTDLVRRLA